MSLCVPPFKLRHRCTLYLQATLKKILFPVKRVAVIVASPAAAKAFKNSLCFPCFFPCPTANFYSANLHYL